jgi:HSP20 family protein
MRISVSPIAIAHSHGEDDSGGERPMALSEYPTITRWPDMFRDMRRAQNEINRIFGGLRLVPRTEFPPLNLWAGNDRCVLMAEVPGVIPDQLDITVHNDTVTLRGKRDPEPIDGEATVLRSERAQGPFVRTAGLPFRVDAEKVVARFERGVLTLELPRPAADQPRQIKVSRA